MRERRSIRTSRDLAADEERQRRVRNMKGMVAVALWGAGCYLLYFMWSFTQTLAPPFSDGLGIAVYLVTFFYIFAFWPIHSLVERLFPKPSAAAGSDQKP